jgi:hypothetical protein
MTGRTTLTQWEDMVQAPDYAMYEAKKAAWIKANPQATPAEYEAAMRVIARECRT